MNIMKSLTICIFFSTFAFCQSHVFNPNKKLFAGAEIGLASIYDLQLKPSFQGGIMLEYFLHKKWSISAKVKYFKTGFDAQSSNGKYLGSYTANVICIPISVNYEFGLFKNLKGTIGLGASTNFETQSNLIGSENLTVKDSKNYITINSMFGFNYYTKKKVVIFTTIQVFNAVDDKANYLEKKQNSGFSPLFSDPSEYSNKRFGINTITTNIGVKFQLN